jgi:signal transduction histidine kinase/serine phosphatase RsbU (regulator of sigma subunit)/anti-sigma regulatory factor (Ser/Thr protein kinase)
VRLRAFPSESISASLATGDWAENALGPRAQWTPALKTAWGISACSASPTILFWGTPHVALYNEALANLMGLEYPQPFHQRMEQMFPQVWGEIAPKLSGEGDERCLIVERAGQREEAYFFFSSSPVLGDGDSVEGIFCTVAETTKSTLANRRLHAIQDLKATITSASSIAETAAAAVQSLSRGPDVTACAIDIVDSRTGLHIHERAGDPHAELDIALALTEGLGEVGTIRFARNPLCKLDEEYHGFLRRAVRQVSFAIARAGVSTAVEELDRAKSTFFNAIGHEFRTPLTLILGPLEELATQLPDIDQRQTALIARRNAIRLQKLVSELLDFSRFESDRVDARYEHLDPTTATKELVSEFSSAFALAGLTLRYEPQPIAEGVWLDRTMYEKIVLTLLSNALKFTVTGGAVVRSSACGRHFVLEVVDSGAAITPDELPHVFERFTCVRGERSRTHEGMGIGLALVAELVKLHGGDISATSTAEGTAFTIRIPLGSAHLPAERLAAPTTTVDHAVRAGFREEAIALVNAPNPMNEVAPRAGARRVLVAGDNADLRFYLAHILQKYDVETVSDGEELLRAAHRHPPDIIIMDMMMPKLRGREAARALREDHQTQHIPILALSSRVEGSEHVDEHDRTVDDYVLKPFTAAQLLARVDALIHPRIPTGTRGERTLEGPRARGSFGDAADRFVAAQDANAVYHAIAETLVPDFADWCVVHAVTEDELPVRAVAHRQPVKRDLMQDISREMPCYIGDESTMSYIVATGKSVFIPHFTTDVVAAGTPRATVRAILGSLGVASMISVPVRAFGRIIAVVTAMQEHGRTFLLHDVEKLERLATRAGLACENVRARQRTRTLSSTLQHALLPDDLPAVDGIQFSIAYTPADDDARTGGDWYDVFPLPDGRVGISIGDMVGHGLRAAIAMTTMRKAIRAYAREHATPAAILAHVNDVLFAAQSSDLATALVAIIDPQTLDVAFASAGHYGPIVVGSDGRASSIEAHGCLLGVTAETTYEERTLRLAPGATFTVYTDGLIEQHRTPIEGGGLLMEAASLAARCDDPAPDLLRRILGEERPHDDVAVLTLKAMPSLEHVDLTIPALPQEAPRARRALRRFLHGSALTAQRAEELLIASGEAIGNAIEHAYRDSEGDVRVTAWRNSGDITINIRDFGTWHEREPGPNRGFGLPLTHAFSDDVTITKTALGTHVRILARVGETPALA